MSFSCVQIYAASLVEAVNLDGGSAAHGSWWLRGSLDRKAPGLLEPNPSSPDRTGRACRVIRKGGWRNPLLSLRMILPRRHGDTETRRHGDRSSRVSLRCALLRVSVPPWQIIRSRSLSLLFSCGQIYAARLVGAFNLGGGSAALGFPWALPCAWIRLRLETLRHLFLNSGMLATTRRARCALTVNCSPDLFMPAPNAFHHPKTLSSPTRQEGCGPS